MYTLSGCRIGYRPGNIAAYRAFNFFTALLLIMVTFPVLVTISVLLLITQGPRIVYRGPRLGKDGRQFQIFKFRTLCPTRARELTFNCTLPLGANIETPLGGFLRESRLDELPQLFNILLGDMNICGPRPVRPEIAAVERARIKNYDLRFSVKPGLIGPTQAFFSHGASKRVRARMNNRQVKQPVSIRAELSLLGCISLSVLGKIARKIRSSIAGSKPGRAAPHEMWVAMEGGRRICLVNAIGMRRITVQGAPSANGDGTAVLFIRLRSGALRKARIILSEAEGYGVFNYSAETEYGEFIIERYALRLVVVPPKLGTIRNHKEILRDWEQACA